VLADSRAKFASLVNADPTCIVWEGCATESINHVLRLADPGTGLVVGATEHVAVLEAAAEAVRRGAIVVRVAPGPGGSCSPRTVASAVTATTVLVSFMHANNETGAISDVRGICDAVRAASATLRAAAGDAPALRPLLVHSDCSQSLGKVPVDVAALGVDLATFAGHKLYGPKGVGATYVRQGVALPPFLVGAAQEGGRRAGTEATPAIAGLGVAAALAEARLADEPARLAGLCGRLAFRLKAGAAHAGLPLPVVNGPLCHWFAALDFSGDAAACIAPAFVDGRWVCLPNTLSISFPGTLAPFVLARLSDTVAASAGAACHSHDASVRPSHVLHAMGVAPDVAAGTLRLSLGRGSSEEEVDEAAVLIIEAVAAEQRASSSAPAAAARAAAPLVTDAAFLRNTYAFTLADAAVTALCIVGLDGALLNGASVGPALGAGALPATHALVLSATVAHPQGGGQPADAGTIVLPQLGLAFRFTAARWGVPPHEGAVVHYGSFVEASAPAAVAAALAAGRVSASITIDAAQRMLHARLHSAGHLLDAAVRAVWPSPAALAAGATPLKPGRGFHFAPDVWVEYDGVVPEASRAAFVAEVNSELLRLVAADAPTGVVIYTKADVQGLAAVGIDAAVDLAHLSPTASVRVVSVGGAANTCPCGGTHVERAGQLGAVTVTRVKVAKGKTKLSYSVQVH